MMILVRELFDESKSKFWSKILELFTMADTEERFYKINPILRGTNDAQNVKIFRLFGLMLAKAILEKIPLTAYLDHSILCHLSGK